MRYTYTIRRAEPKLGLLGVIYHTVGHDDYFKNFNTDDFTEANVQQLVESHAPEMRAYWDAYDRREQAVELPVGAGGEGDAALIIQEDEPEYDPRFEVLAPTEVVDETINQTTRGWEIQEKSLEEIKAVLIQDVAAARYTKEGEGVTWIEPGTGTPYYLDTTVDSQNRFASARVAIEGATRVDGGVWKCADLSSGAPVLAFRSTSNAELIEWSALAHDHVQKCFEAEAIATAKITAAVDVAAAKAVDYETEFLALV